MIALLVGIAMGTVAATLVIFGFAIRSYVLGAVFRGIRVTSQPDGNVAIHLAVKRADEVTNGPPCTDALCTYVFTPAGAIDLADEISRRALAQINRSRQENP